jgi:hypothetical protein
VISFSILPAVAQAPPPAEESPAPAAPALATPAPETPWHRTAGKLEAALVLTPSSASFLREWKRSGAAEEEAEISSLASVRRGDTVDAVVLFAGCTPKSTGHCDSEVDFRVLRPDGSLYTKFEEVELWKNRLVPLGSRMRAGQTSLELEIEPEDPLGTYRVEAVVRDLVSGRQMRLTRELEVLEAVEP